MLGFFFPCLLLLLLLLLGFPGFLEVCSDSLLRVLRSSFDSVSFYKFYDAYLPQCPINPGIKAANSRYWRILLTFLFKFKG